MGFATDAARVVDSSEYRMRQHEAPGLQGVHEELALRQATASRADLDFLRDCIRRGFHVPEEAIAADDWVARAKETLVIEQAGVPVGVIRVDRDLGRARPASTGSSCSLSCRAAASAAGRSR